MNARALIVLPILLLTACSLPGHQGGPGPRSTQYTYPGRSWNPDTGMAHSPIPTVGTPEDGGVFAFGIVFADGTTGTSVSQHESRAACERERREYDAVVKEAGARVMTVRCHRAHETGGMQGR